MLDLTRGGGSFSDACMRHQAIGARVGWRQYPEVDHAFARDPFTAMPSTGIKPVTRRERPASGINRG
jgi:hypothetical protein